MKGYRHRLRRERQRRLKAIRGKLLEPGSLNEVRRDLEWISLCDRCSNAKSHECFIRKVLPVVAVLVGLLLVVGSYFRLPRVQFIAEVQATTVEFRLNRSWTLSQPFSARSLILEGMENVHALGSIFSGVGSEIEPATRADLRGGKATVRELAVVSGAVVTLSSDSSELELAVKNGTVSGIAAIEHGLLIVENSQGNRNQLQVQTASQRPPETLNFASASNSKRAASVRAIHPTSAFRESVDIDEVQFLEEARGTSDRINSTVLGGSIRVLQTNTSTPLSEDDYLEFSDIECTRIEIICEVNGNIHFVLQGSATSLLAGTRGYMQNLKPTLLEYLYTQPLWLKVLLGVFLVLFPLVLSFRDLVLKGGV